MDDFPIQVVLFPIISIALVVGFLVYRKKAIAGYDQQYANYRSDALAQRLRMQLVAGDPSFNWFIRQANVDVQRGPADGRPIHIEVRMQGSPHGVPLELVYLYRVEQETSLTHVTWRTWFDCRMIGHAKQAFPAFEVRTRNAPVGPIVATMAIPEVATGNPAVDSIYHVATQEPGMAQLLGQLLPAWGQFANSGIHLIGDGQTVSFKMKQDKAPLLANALYYAEAMAEGLSELTRRVGG